MDVVYNTVCSTQLFTSGKFKKRKFIFYNQVDSYAFVFAKINFRRFVEKRSPKTPGQTSLSGIFMGEKYSVSQLEKFKRMTTQRNSK